jgi:hypothetical protein
MTNDWVTLRWGGAREGKGMLEFSLWLWFH